MGETEIKDGAVKGDNVTFSVVRNFGGNEFTIKYTGKVSTNEMKMERCSAIAPSTSSPENRPPSSTTAARCRSCEHKRWPDPCARRHASQA